MRVSQQDPPKSTAKSRRKAPVETSGSARAPEPLSVEDQLAALAACGIRLSEGASCTDVLARASREALESSPFEALLRALGGEALGHAAKALSDQVFYLECDAIKDDGDYVRIVNQLARLAGEALPLTVLGDHVDLESDDVWIDIELDGVTHRLTAAADDGWLDMTVVGEIARWLERRSPYGFYLYALGQDCLVVCLPRRSRARLSRVTGMSFAPLSSLTTSEVAAPRHPRQRVEPTRSAAGTRTSALPSGREGALTRDRPQRPDAARATERERLGEGVLDETDAGACPEELAQLAALGRSGKVIQAEVVGVGPHGCDVLLDGMALTYCLLPPENMRAEKRHAILDRWRERVQVRVVTVIGHGLRPAFVVEVDA
jgi:hypothetical protein